MARRRLKLYGTDPALLAGFTVEIDMILPTGRVEMVATDAFGRLCASEVPATRGTTRHNVLSYTTQYTKRLQKTG